MNYRKTISLLFTILLFTSCGKTESTTTSSTDTSNTSTSASQSETEKETVVKKKFESIQFSDLTVLFDGKEHQLEEAKGYPEGTTVTYTGRDSYIDVGTYTASVKLVKDGYEDYEASATLTILPIEYSSISFDSKSVTYDGLDHINDVQLVGFLPEGTTTTKTIKDENGNNVTSAIQVGKYYYTISLHKKNYKDMTLSATLTINGTKKDTPLVHVGDTTYFANGLDHYYLYRYTDGTVSKVDSTTPKKLKELSSSALSISNSLFTSSAKEISGTTTDVLYTDSTITDFVEYSDSIYYYSKNALSESDSGIYKVTVPDNSDTSKEGKEPTVEKVFNGKSDKLALNGDYLYFENKSQDDHIFKMNLSSKTTTLVLNQKVHEYVISNNYLYCTVNGTLNDYIGKLNLSSTSTEAEKMTNAAGENLVVKNGYLYYNYTDLYGYIDETQKGIWKINVNNDNATQVLSSSRINAFDVISSDSLVYIDSNTLHLHQYTVSSNTNTDLLSSFVPVEDVPINMGGKSEVYNGRIYYLDMYRGKTLNCYDPKSQTLTQLTDNKVMDFSIIGDTLYFNQVTNLTNNDLYSVNLKNGGETTKLSANDTRNIISDGTYLYGTHYNFWGVSGGIFRMKLDGSEYVKFSEVNGAKNFAIKDGKLYFINCTTGQDNGDIQYYNLSDITSDSDDLKANELPKTNKIENVKQFIFEGDTIYYIYEGTIYNFIARSSMTTMEEGVKLANKECAPKEMIIVDNDIYYYTYPKTSSDKAGLYKVNKNNTTADTDITSLLKCDSTYYCSALSYLSGKIYFLNYSFLFKVGYGNAHFYQFDITTKTTTKIN